MLGKSRSLSQQGADLGGHTYRAARKAPRVASSDTGGGHAARCGLPAANNRIAAEPGAGLGHQKAGDACPMRAAAPGKAICTRIAVQPFSPAWVTMFANNRRQQ